MTQLVDNKIDVKVKISALWASFMFLSIYIDYFHLYMPGSLQGLLEGTVFTFRVTPDFLSIVMIPLTISSVMIGLSLLLPARPNRIANLVFAIAYIPYATFNLVGEAWLHMIVAVVIEDLLFLAIVVYAWTWPKENRPE